MGKNTFTSVLEDFNSVLWGCHLKVPDQIALLYIIGNNRRVICTLNDKESFHAGLLPNKEYGYFININKEIRKKLGLQIGDEVSVSLIKDESKYGIAICEEFEMALEMDPVAADYFHDLTPGKQRSLIYIASKPKRSETRLNKTMVILDFLKINEGLLDYKLLNQAFKTAG